MNLNINGSSGLVAQLIASQVLHWSVYVGGCQGWRCCMMHLALHCSLHCTTTATRQLTVKTTYVASVQCSSDTSHLAATLQYMVQREY